MHLEYKNSFPMLFLTSLQQSSNSRAKQSTLLEAYQWAGYIDNVPASRSPNNPFNVLARPKSVVSLRIPLRSNRTL